MSTATATATVAAPVSSTTTKPPVAPQKAPPFAISSVRKGDRWLKILIYGRQGAGKTTLAGSAVDVSRMRDVLFINIESGDLTFEDNPRIQNVDKLDQVEVNNFKQVAKIYEFLSSHCKFRDTDNQEKLRQYESWLKGCDPEDIKEPRKYRTVVIDSLTELEAYCMYGLLGIHGEFDITQIDDDMKTAEFSEYKKNNNMVNLLVRAFRDLPMNVVIVAAQEYAQDELKRFHYTPALTGKLKTQVQGYFDIVGYLSRATPDDKGNAPTRLYIQPIGKFDAKNRRASYKESFFDDPTMSSIMKAVGLMQDVKQEG